jgi:hypothetical protein
MDCEHAQELVRGHRIDSDKFPEALAQVMGCNCHVCIDVRKYDIAPVFADALLIGQLLKRSFLGLPVAHSFKWPR